MKVTWVQDPDLITWRAACGDTTLMVKRLGVDSWRPEVHRPGQKPENGSARASRTSAQRWAEREAGKR